MLLMKSITATEGEGRYKLANKKKEFEFQPARGGD